MTIRMIAAPHHRLPLLVLLGLQQLVQKQVCQQHRAEPCGMDGVLLEGRL